LRKSNQELQMRKGTMLLSGLLVWSIGLPAYAQQGTQDHKTTSPATSETERPKNEVDHQLEEAKKRGETVLAACIEDCDGKEVSGDFERGHALELPKPNYPAIARAAHASGTALVQIIIDEDGKVSAAAAVSGHPLLYGVSAAAARQARFTPMKFNGKPVKVTGVISYNFVPQ
jgi:TonB family protein